jgi:hypothetical protein
MPTQVSNSKRVPRRAFTPNEVQQVWDKASHKTGADPRYVRKDAAGFVIHRFSPGGQHRGRWDVDHRVPHACGGGNNMSNLQALGRTRNQRRGAQTWDRWVGENGYKPGHDIVGPARRSRTGKAAAW